MKAYVARHGQNLDNASHILNGHRDRPLTKRGFDEARRLALRMRDASLQFDAVYVSPLLRAKQTAAVIAEVIPTPKPEVMTDLIERDFGVMTGRREDRIEQLCGPEVLRTENEVYFLSPEGAETFPDLVTRGNRVLTRLAEAHPGGEVLLVTHGDFGKMLYAAYYGLEWRHVLSLFHFGNSEVLLLSKDTDPGQAHLFRMLDTPNSAT